MKNHRPCWFKAKSAGYGGSVPLTWQGRVVDVALFGGMGCAVVSGDNVGQQALGVWMPILLCLPICWVFGQPLRGQKDSRAP